MADQSGVLWAVDIATAGPDSNSRSFDLSTIRTLVDLSTCDGRGLLGVAFHPQYNTSGADGFGLFYTYTSEQASGRADFSTVPAGQADHQSVIVEWEVSSPSDVASLANATMSRILLRIDQPQCDKNGGALSFGPDELLYIALGDGGGVDDQGLGHSADGNGQDRGNVLGAILRIDPTSPNPSNGRYGIPTDNPFSDEIYAYGLQNPSQLSFDTNPENQILYVSEVGQFIQEINLAVSGGNYGWNRKEGTFRFENGGLGDEAPNSPADLIDPVSQYDPDEGSQVVGGVVYRGAISALSGRYIFGDKRGTSACNGRLFVFQEVFDFGTDLTDFLVRSNDPLIRSAIAELGQSQLAGRCILGFGRDAAGEVYVLANGTGTPSPDANGTGVVMKITP